MAAKTKGVAKVYKMAPKKKRNVDSKGATTNKGSKNYRKPYRAQGR